VVNVRVAVWKISCEIVQLVLPAKVYTCRRGRGNEEVKDVVVDDIAGVSCCYRLCRDSDLLNRKIDARRADIVLRSGYCCADNVDSIGGRRAKRILPTQPLPARSTNQVSSNL
jgi:hypothetical protein